MAAGRLLLQRGLRLNKDQPSLWHEYFRLELLYVEKILTRRRILGISAAAQQETDEMDIDDQQQLDDSSMIQLPKMTGEDMDNDDSKAINQLEESTAEALKEGSNPILQGLLATIVYKNAILGNVVEWAVIERLLGH